MISQLRDWWHRRLGISLPIDIPYRADEHMIVTISMTTEVFALILKTLRENGIKVENYEADYPSKNHVRIWIPR